MAVITNTNNKTNSQEKSHCTLAFVRALTRPFVNPPTIHDLLQQCRRRDNNGDNNKNENTSTATSTSTAATSTSSSILMSPWNVRLPIDPTDYTTRHHWKSQKRTTLFHSMFLSMDWDQKAVNPDEAYVSTTASLHPYFSFGQEPTSPFFAPWQDAGNCLRHLLLHQIGCQQTSQYISLKSQNIHLFIATAPDFPESQIQTLVLQQQQQHAVQSCSNNQEEAPPPSPRPIVSRVIDPQYYLLRCHYNARRKLLIFGCHHHHHHHHHHPHHDNNNGVCDDSSTFLSFHKVLELSVLDENWRLNACIVLKNLARILHCHKDYTVPLIWSPNRKLSLVVGSGKGSGDEHDDNDDDNGDDKSVMMIQKVYTEDSICNEFKASVQNMVDIYQLLKQHNVPHTDRLVSVQHRHGKRRRVVEQQQQQQQQQSPARGGGRLGGASQEEQEDSRTTTICKFAPLGRSYLPENLQELLQALICIAEALVELHSINIMHRDIRWANVFHALSSSSSGGGGGGGSTSVTTQTPDNRNNHMSEFTNEWVLFDFEFAARVPQPAFAAHTLTPGNHAPEMIDGDNHTNQKEQHHQTLELPPPLLQHDTAVDIWGLGYLIQNCHVDIPRSHEADLHQLQNECLQRDPRNRPTATACLEILRKLRTRPPSKEKTVTETY